MKIILKGELPDDLTSIGLKPGHLLNAEVEPGSQRAYFDCHVTDFEGSECVSCVVDPSNYLIVQTSMPAPDPDFLEIEVREGSDQMTAEIAIEKGATTLLIPLNARKQLNDLSDEMITKINIQYYSDLKDCLLKALVE